jgi:hypothetical protein
MKTYSFFRNLFLLTAVLNLFSVSGIAQQKQTLAVLSIDTKNIQADNQAMTNLVMLELEKTDLFEIIDKYDVEEIMKKNGFDRNQFGKTALLEAGRILKTDKMLTGSCEKIGEKIILILKLLDSKTQTFEKTSVMEYLNLQVELQLMVRISINNLLGLPNDQNQVDLLVNYSQPVNSPKTKMNLSGPRMGASYTLGEYGKRLSAEKSEGGYNMFPVISTFGYQLETQYLSSGDFQALLEFVGALNGLESGQIIPSATFMNGFRFNKSGIEFGLGPIFRMTKVAEGYYDDNGKWTLADEFSLPTGKTLEESIDNRGKEKLSTGLIVAIGKTFKSGYLNIPVNVYFTPRKEGTLIGLTFGFNTSRGRRSKS